jgi:hypothetical protein
MVETWNVRTTEFAMSLACSVGIDRAHFECFGPGEGHDAEHGPGDGGVAVRKARPGANPC